MGEFGIAVNVISPFGMSADDKRWRETHPELLEQIIQTVPLGRFGDAEQQVGSLAPYVATDEDIT